MLMFQASQWSTLGQGREREFLRQVARDIIAAYPERFGTWSEDKCHAFVQARRAIAEGYGITETRDVVAFIFIEQRLRQDMSRIESGHWAESMLRSGLDGRSKMQLLEATADSFEVPAGAA